jgi:type II secretory pathway pseudopilin PulG
MEMAIVLMILGTLLSGVLVGVGQSTENSRRLSARNQLRQIEEALYAFAQSRGRLPCPATDTSGGQEDPSTGSGACTVLNGFVPATTLGFVGSVNDDGLLLDPWQNPLRYSVASYDTSSATAYSDPNGIPDFTGAGELQTLYPYYAGTTLLRVCSDAPCTSVISDIAPAIVLSMGADWATFGSAAEQANASGAVLGVYSVTSTTDFVSTDYSEDNFDDQLVWLSPYILFSRMISAGKLP